MSVLRYCGQISLRLSFRNLNYLPVSNAIFIKSSKTTYPRQKHIGINLQTRNFSLQATIESIAQTQTGIFQTISESAPVECVQGLLLTIHGTTGLPWWATIMCTTIMLRSLVTVPLAIYQQYIMAKVENLNIEMPEIVKEINKEMAVAIRLYNWDEKRARIEFKRAVKKQWSNLVVRDNCHPVKGSLLMWFQIPMWVSFSVSLRNLVYELPKLDFDAKVAFRELSMGGFGWIPNLVEVDSSLILPITLGLLNLAIIELQVLSKVHPPTRFQSYLTNFLRVFSVLMVPICASVPSCLALYWTTSSAYGLVQNLVLMSPKVKRSCKIPPAPSQQEKPYAHICDGLKHRFRL